MSLFSVTGVLQREVSLLKMVPTVTSCEYCTYSFTRFCAVQILLAIFPVLSN